MVAEIWASVISPFVDQWVALSQPLITPRSSERHAAVAEKNHFFFFLFLNNFYIQDFICN